MDEIKLTGESKDIVSENISKLRGIFPDIFTEDKVDFNKLKINLGEYVNEYPEKYNFTWPGKTQAIKESQKQSTGTLRPCKDESKKWDTTQNLYIEGDNLEVLKLLQKGFYNKIKCIYIDPPYNTGTDFVYKDDFKDNIENYLKISGQTYDSKSENTVYKLISNPETHGRFHSNWLNMMYPRLKLAKNLLRDDGVIFISIDENELDNLKKICDEIFGSENFRNFLIIRRGVKNLQAQFDSISKLNNGFEFILMYSKNSNAKFKKLYKIEDKEAIGSWNNHWRGTDRPTMRYTIFGITPETGQWRWSKERSYNAIKNYADLCIELNNRNPSNEEIDKWYLNKTKELGVEKIDLLRLSKTNKPEHYVPPSNKKLLNDLWTDLKPNGSSQLSKLFSKKMFDTPKSVDLINRMINFVMDKNDIILDFFSGSGTTAHSVFKSNLETSKNNRFILVQIPELTNKKSEAHKAGYKTICEIGKERIRRAGDKIVEESGNKELDIGFKVFKLTSSNLKKWDPDYNNIQESLIIDNIKEDRTNEDLIYEIMIKYGIDLTLPIEKHDNIYSIGFGALVICLDDNITKDIINIILEISKKSSVSRVVFKDSSFASDADKTNIKEILKTNHIDEFITI